MKRKIKFRIWDKDGNEMISGDGFTFDDYILINYMFNDFKRFDFMQYTGIKDCKGREIYEGDIVSSWSKGVQGKGVIKQRVDGLWIIYPAFSKGKIWGLCPNQEGISTVEVIGNIYENPELLED